MISSVWAWASLESARCTIPPTAILSSKSPQAMIARIVFPLAPRVFKGERLLAFAMIAISWVRLGDRYSGYQRPETVGLDESLCLETPRVVTALRTPRQNAGSSIRCEKNLAGEIPVQGIDACFITVTRHPKNHF